MPRVCLYLQLHQPYRLRDFSVFEVGQGAAYFSQLEAGGNGEIFQKVAQKSYVPMLKLLLTLTQRHPNFVFALSCSGVFVEQAERYQPQVIILLQQLAQTGQVEFLAETYYHSLASLYSPTEFARQVALHTQMVQRIFGVTPKVFRNTELIYSNQVAEQVAGLGFHGMLTEAVPRYLHQHQKTQVFQSLPVSSKATAKSLVASTSKAGLPLLLKHAELSDDLAFRFSDKNWQWYPLGANQYTDWIKSYSRQDIINLFMDFETFGEHQWADTGIFAFFETMIDVLSQDKNIEFRLPSQLLVPQPDIPQYDVPEPISWADVDRDLTAWTANAFQQDCIEQLYDWESAVMASQDELVLADWRKLQTSDHFYYMCTKWSADGDVHAYFSPYRDPYEAYRRYNLVLTDLKQRIFG